MAIPRRLNSGNRFERSQNRDVKRVVFLSVEGNVTEPQYFGFIKRLLNNTFFQTLTMQLSEHPVFAHNEMIC